MHYIHKAYTPKDTIAAISTPHGEGGIAVIRISGEKAISSISKIFSGPIQTYKSHTAHLGKIYDLTGVFIDEVLVLVMLGSKSFTGEDTVEIHCHGGYLVTKKVLEAVISCGVRPAGPGEFSFKAFMNGKIDLAQAEAIQELIGAKNEIALQKAEDQLQGALSKKIKSFQKELFDIAAIIEAWIDFPEEGLEFATQNDILTSIVHLIEKMDKLILTFSEGKMLKEGLSLCLIGPPNAGKSSLMNALLGKDRAIVTDIPGTTRDILEDDLFLCGLHFKIKDTAGIRQTEEMIEREGIKRSIDALEKADLVLLLFDQSQALSDEQLHLFSLTPAHKTIVVWNKADLAKKEQKTPPFLSVTVSAKELTGLEDLKVMMNNLIWKNGVPSQDDVIITTVRHKNALMDAAKALRCVADGIKNNVSPEFLSSDIRKALIDLGTIIGSDISEEILGAIFSKFCVGK